MQQHGDFTMQCDGQILICRPHGTFNMQGAMAYEPLFMRNAMAIAIQPWAVLEVAKEFEAGTPEVIERFRRQFNWCAENNCRYLAVIFDGHFKRFLADQIFLGLPFDAVKYFNNEAEGKEWLHARLASL